MEKALADLSVRYQPQVLGVTNITVANDQQLLDALLTVTGGETITLSPGSYSEIKIIGGKYNQIWVGAKKVAGKAPNPSSVVRITSANPTDRKSVV